MQVHPLHNTYTQPMNIGTNVFVHQQSINSGVVCSMVPAIKPVCVHTNEHCKVQDTCSGHLHVVSAHHS